MGIGMWELLIILAIVLVIFGAKKLRNLGGDLGGAIKNFKTAMKEEEGKTATPAGGEAGKLGSEPGRVIDAEVTKEKKNV
jgi:sec-independent protein translocase protein TatA